VTTGSSNSLITKIGPDGVGATANPIEGGGKAFFSQSSALPVQRHFRSRAAFASATETNGRALARSELDILRFYGPEAQTWLDHMANGESIASTGLTTSNFAVNDAGEVVDNRIGLIFLK